MANIHEKLIKIQSKLKAPKNHFNKFGGYHYRNCEDILEGLKPLLEEHQATLLVTDDLVMVGERYYIKATATLIDVETGEKLSATGFAREEENKKGMDSMQLSGATGSYARKYALNGLFAIDDTKDSDTLNKHGKDKPQSNKSNEGTISEGQAKRIFALSNGKADVCKTVIEKYGYKKSSEVKISDYNNICDEVQKLAK